MDAPVQGLLTLDGGKAVGSYAQVSTSGLALIND